MEIRHRVTVMSKKNPPCVKCKVNITQVRKPGFSCDTCKLISIHASCAAISDATFADIANGKFSWTCNNCKKKQKDRRQSLILPAAAATSLVSSPSTSSLSTEKLLQDLTVAFNEYKRATDDRILLLESLSEEKSQKVESIAASIEKVETSTETLSRLIAEKALEIQGVPEGELNNPLKAVQDVGADIGCVISSEDVECEVSRTTTTPVLVVNFVSKSVRRSFLHAGKKFNREKKRIVRLNESHKIYVNEKLTANQKKLLYNTKNFARDFGYQFAWFCNGDVHLKKENLAKLIIVKSQLHLEALASHESERLLPERAGVEIENQRNVSSSQEQ